eukprot:TRINITY_DN76264_c0_g1_i1.p1 TRINITY_DN76264_c0_g1~~TRINITY_DN76264_c0_g1_i1.p1  ORF type:complete len:266 (-),score=44.68 TRINITY_DN76264_c0_g1_i1:53-850(-)
MAAERVDLLLLLLHVAYSASAFGVAHALLLPLARSLKVGSKNEGSSNEWANYVIASSQAIFSGSAAARALLVESPFAEALAKVAVFAPAVDTVHGHSSTLELVMPFILGYFVYDLALPCLVHDVPADFLMTMHHIMCIVVWPLSYYNDTGCFYVLCFIAAELSTPLLWLVVYFFPKHGIDGILRTVLGVMMALIFFLVRVLPSPMLLASLVSSQRFWEDVHPSIYAVAMLTLPLPAFLFTFWFCKMVKGMIEALSSTDDGKAKAA